MRDNVCVLVLSGDGVGSVGDVVIQNRIKTVEVDGLEQIIITARGDRSLEMLVISGNDYQRNFDQSQVLPQAAYYVETV